jgi:hypothetical protein
VHVTREICRKMSGALTRDGFSCQVETAGTDSRSTLREVWMHAALDLPLLLVLVVRAEFFVELSRHFGLTHELTNSTAETSEKRHRLSAAAAACQTCQ